MKNILFDTDLGTDSDDIGALSILCNLHKQHKINLLAVTSCASTDEPVQAIRAIASCYDVDVPVGKSYVAYADDDNHGAYAREIARQYPQFKQDNVADAVRVLRQALLNGDVTLVTVGPLNNIAHLLSSGADDISPLSGVELFRQGAKEMYVMAGTFSNNWAEWNIAEDVEAMRFVSDNVTCPMTFIPFELGIKVKTGANFLNGADSPMKLGYYTHNKGPRESWDPITSYCATVECLPTSPWGRITVDEQGITKFVAGEGNRRYVLDTIDVDDVTQKLEELMVI